MLVPSEGGERAGNRRRTDPRSTSTTPALLSTMVAATCRGCRAPSSRRRIAAPSSGRWSPPTGARRASGAVAPRYTRLCRCMAGQRAGLAAPPPPPPPPPAVAPVVSPCYQLGAFDVPDGVCQAQGALRCHGCGHAGAFEPCGEGCVPLGVPCSAESDCAGLLAAPSVRGRTCAGAAAIADDSCPLLGNFQRCSSTDGTCVPAYLDDTLGLLRAPPRPPAHAAACASAGNFAACGSGPVDGICVARAPAMPCRQLLRSSLWRDLAGLHKCNIVALQ